MRKIFKTFNSSSPDTVVSDFLEWYNEQTEERQAELDSSLVFLEGDEGLGVAVYTNGRVYYTLTNASNMVCWGAYNTALTTGNDGYATWDIVSPVNTLDITATVYLNAGGGVLSECTCDVSTELVSGDRVIHISVNPGLGASAMVPANTYYAVCTVKI